MSTLLLQQGNNILKFTLLNNCNFVKLRTPAQRPGRCRLVGASQSGRYVSDARRGRWSEQKQGWWWLRHVRLGCVTRVVYAITQQQQQHASLPSSTLT